MATIIDNAQDEKLLYQLFEAHVKKELKDRLKPEADKILDACIDGAIESMKGSLRQHYDMLNDSRTLQIILEKKQ